MALQVKLQRRSEYGRGQWPGLVSVLKSLPYMATRAGKIIHRVRAGSLHYWRGKYSHAAFAFHCGGGGLTGERHGARLLDAPNVNGMPLCHKCETMAVKRGQPSSEAITGGPVKYHMVVKGERHETT